MKKCDIIKLKLVSLFFATILPLFFIGCWWKSAEKKEDMPLPLEVINVLDKDYYDDCHITGSKNIPFEQFENELKNLDKQKEYVIYCSNYACTAAPFAAKMMKDAGFSNVVVFDGGIVEWFQEGYPCEGQAVKDYLQEENNSLDEDDEKDRLDDTETNDGIIFIEADDLKDKMIKAGLLQ
ncbi:rhodanese-like domain-containing protein [Candidatus Dependentiae bacterium]|nr:rhodanese-like domain-containing protein [Candidatus Dependentiae bacterium]